MTRLLPSIALILAVAAPTLATPQASENGACPPPLSSPVSVLKRADPTPPTNGVHYLGAVTVSVALSDTGHICAVDVVKGIEPALDKQAIDAIRQQPFQPIRVDGKPVPGFMTIQRDFWRGDTSDILISQNADASPDEMAPDARLAHAADVSSLIASGKVDGSRYRNKYFDISFAAPGAAFTAPSEVDGQGRNVRLVDAVVAGQKREDRYTISVLADRLSNYPELKSRKEYIEGIASQLGHTGIKTIRDPFPYVISGVEFVGIILQESDGANLSHFRGMFSTPMKGYILSLDIAAANEGQVLKIASSIEFKQGQ